MKMLKYVAYEQADGLITMIDHTAKKHSVSLRVEAGFEMPADRKLLYLIEPKPMHVEVFVDGEQLREGPGFQYKDGWIVWSPTSLNEGTEIRVRCYAKEKQA